MQELMANLRREMEIIKKRVKHQGKNIVSEIKNSLNGLSSIVDTKESVNQKTEITHFEHKEKKQKKEQGIQEVQDNIKQSNAYYEGEGEEKNDAEEIFEEIIAKYFPKLMKDNKPQIQEAQRPPNSIKTKQNLDMSQSNW